MMNRADEHIGAAFAADKPVGDAAYGYKPGEWRDLGFMDDFGLPVDCPLVPLGYDDDVYYFLDTCGQVRAVQDKMFSRNKISSLFMGRNNYAQHHWPKLREGKIVTGIAADKATDDLMGACAHKGSWNDVESVRGRGCWRGLDGELLISLGDRIITVNGELTNKEIDGFVYPSRPAMPGPVLVKEDGAGPAATILPLIRTWNWQRPELDPVLMLGFIGAGFLSGALEWRPSIFITGDKATGKSTLQKLVKGLMGSWLIQSADTTAAGIYQRVKHDALPVSVDELESEKDPIKQKSIIKLARLSSSGALMLRGGADHKGTEFQARSCFIFSSINHPPLEPQDLSRMALLCLNRLPDDAKLELPTEREIILLGKQCIANILNNWHRFDATLAHYSQMLQQAGHDGRGQDTFGTLLACADLIVDGDAEALGLAMAGLPAEPWIEHLRADRLAEYEDAETNWRLCLNHILSTPIDAWRSGSRSSVGELLDSWLSHADDRLDRNKVKNELVAAGMTLLKPTERGGPALLFIPNQNPTLQRLFHGTKWYGEIGAGTWGPALRQGVQDGWIFASKQGRVSGVKCRGVGVSIPKIGEGLEKKVSGDGKYEADW